MSTPSLSPTAEAIAPVFRRQLLDWFAANARTMPWRLERDPYHIWVSEIMLQQTRVDQATPYFNRFMEAFPTVEVLANALLDEVLLKWEGLGYYSRARNLHKAAGIIMANHDGKLPDTYESLLDLPGIGPYTAAAISSIAFGLPQGVLDGNVMRVLTRLFCDDGDVTRPITRRRLQEAVNTLLDPQRPGDFNEAIMELGALVCTPAQPQCQACPVLAQCCAGPAGQTANFPVKKKKNPVPHYDIAIGLVFNDADEVLIQQRPPEGLLGGLWEFPGGKIEAGETAREACVRELAEELGIEVETGKGYGTISHAYSHFKITLHPYRCRLVRGTPVSSQAMPIQWAPLHDLDSYAFPRANRRLIDALTHPPSSPTLFD